MTIFDSVAKMILSTLVAGQQVETKAYKTSVGGARYNIVTPAQYVDTPDEFGDVTIANGNIAELAEDTPNLFQLGIVEGVFDNGPALKAAFENRHKIILAMDGTAQLHTAVVATLASGKHIVNVGQGRRSIINYTTSVAAITLNVTNVNAFVTLGGLGFTASIDTVNPPLTISYPVQTAYFRRQVSLSNLDVVSATGTNFAFADGIILENVWLSEAINCVVQGDLADETRVASALTLKGTSVGFTLANCQLNHIAKGVKIIDDSRDVVIDGCRITQVTDGVSALLTNQHGRLVVSDTSFAATDHGIITDKINQVSFTGNRLNKVLTSTADYRDAYVKNATGVVINDNVSDGAGASGTDVGVVFESVTSSSVHDNVLLDRPILITLDASTTRVSGAGNVGDVGSTTVVDSGTDNNVTEAIP